MQSATACIRQQAQHESCAPGGASEHKPRVTSSLSGIVCTPGASWRAGERFRQRCSTQLHVVSNAELTDVDHSVLRENNGNLEQWTANSNSWSTGSCLQVGDERS